MGEDKRVTLEELKGKTEALREQVELMKAARDAGGNTKPESNVIELDSKRNIPAPSADRPARPLSPFEVQVGGDHYKRFKIQPVVFSMANGLSFLQGSILKRLVRYNIPGGKGVQDLMKMHHEIDMLIAQYQAEHPEPEKGGEA